MAITESIRKRSGLLIVVIGIAMGAFVLGDLIKGLGPSGGEERSCGKVYGEDIDEELCMEYRQRADKRREVYFPAGSSAGPEAARSIRNYEWQRVIKYLLLGREMEKNGIIVTDEELKEVTAGQNPKYISSFFLSEGSKLVFGGFQDTLTGANGQDSIVASVPKISSWISQAQNSDNPTLEWLLADLTQRTFEERGYEKYFRLITNAMYVTGIEAEQAYIEENERRKIKFVTKKLTEISDDEVSVTEDDIYAYYEEHKNEARYEQGNSRMIEYVRIAMEPSDEDIDQTMKRMESMLHNLERSETAEGDSTIAVRANEAKGYNPNFMAYKQDMPEEMGEAVFAADSGDVVGPFNDNGIVKIVKVFGFNENPQRKARHILFGHSETKNSDTDRTKDEAKAMADSVYNLLMEDSTQFADLAKELSDGPSGPNGGELGWFSSGQMVTNFNDECFNNEPGHIGVVETEFGYHIVHVTGKREQQARTLVIEMPVRAGQQTIKYTKEQAIDFINNANGNDDFKGLAGEYQYPHFESEIQENQFQMNDVTESTKLIGWTRGAMEGEVSNPFVDGNDIIVARLVKIKREGVPDFEDVKEMMRAPTLREKKTALYAEKMSGYNSLDQLSKDFGIDILDAELKFTDNAIPGGGYDPEVIGALFGSYTDGDLIGPIEGTTGVYVMLLEKTYASNEPGDVSDRQAKMIAELRKKNNEIALFDQIFNALYEIADVVDLRDE